MTEQFEKTARELQLQVDFAQRLVHARKMPPHFAENPVEGLMVIVNEVAELSQAIIMSEDPRRVYDEALDVCVTAFRLANGEAGFVFKNEDKDE